LFLYHGANVGQKNNSKKYFRTFAEADKRTDICSMNFENMTVNEFCEMSDQKTDSVLKKLRRAFPGLSFGINTELSDDYLSVLQTDKRTNGQAPKPARTKTDAQPDNDTEPTRRTVAPKPVRKQSVDFSAIVSNISENAAALTFVGVFLGHSSLVWAEIWQMYGKLGMIAGGVLMLISIGAALTSNAQRLSVSSQYAVFVVLILDIFAGFVHFEANFTSNASYWITVALSVLMAGGAFASLILFRHIRQN
jgi:hypothetical protein